MESPVKAGELLAGKYEVLKVLGSGAMGVVVSARHVDLQQIVALKFMLPTALPDQAAGDRFLREAQAAGRLRGEHVARVMDFGRLEGGAPYIVMEFLEGEDLEAILNRDGAFSVGDAALYLTQACAGMDEAHKAGIIHRDLKPQNLFLTKRPDGSPLLKVLDFGISKLNGDVSSVTATQSTTVMGSPAYMSPEQARSAKHVDARGDIYSMGTILYQLVSGSLPFQAESVAGMLVSIVSEPPIPLRDVAPHVPEAFAEIVMRCLEKKKDDRPQTARELGMLLAPFASQRTSIWDVEGEKITGRNLNAEKAKTTTSGEVVVTTMQPSSRPTSNSPPKSDAAVLAASAKEKNPLVLAALAGTGVALLGVAIFFATHKPSDTTDKPASNAVAETAPSAPTSASAAPATTLAQIGSPAAVAPSMAPSNAPVDSSVAAAASAAGKSGGKNPAHGHADAGATIASPSASAHPAPSAAPKPNGGLFDRPE